MLELTNIKKSFGNIEVLHGISFRAEKGKVLAVMGANGAGKSTLLKIISGMITDFSGTITLDNVPVQFKNVKDAEAQGIVMIHQELNLVPELSIAENIFLGKEPVNAAGFIRYDEMYAKADVLLKDFDFPYPSHNKIRNIRLGWQQVVEIAKALRINSRIILMDEPTSSLTESEKELLFKKIHYLKSLGKTILYISHRMSEIMEIADDVLIMRDGNNVGCRPVASYTRDAIVELMVGKRYEVKEPLQKIQREQVALALNGVTTFTRSRKILKDISFSLRRGEILGLAGLLGAGRTSLLKFLYGASITDYKGDIQISGKPYKPTSVQGALRQKIAFLSEDRKQEGIFPELSIRDNTSLSILDRISPAGFVDSTKELALVSSELEAVNTKFSALSQLIIRLSGGNQQKVLLSRLLLTAPSIILLDEPTRGIDVGAKAEIYALIQRLSTQGISFIISSSENPELLQVCHKILVLSYGYQTAILEADKTDSGEIMRHAFQKV